MDISYRGANCVEIIAKQGSFIIDPVLSQVGLKDLTAKDAVVIATQRSFVPKDSATMILEGPGEYEVKDTSVKGVPARRMIDHDESYQTTMYRVVIGDIAIAVVGHAVSPLTEEQLEALGMIDIAIVPIGGSGYTLDAHQAVAVVRQLDPKVVIPTHYADKALSYEVPQMDLEPFIKELSAPHEVVAKYKIKNGILPETITLVEITRS